MTSKPSSTLYIETASSVKHRIQLCIMSAAALSLFLRGRNRKNVRPSVTYGMSKVSPLKRLCRQLMSVCAPTYFHIFAGELRRTTFLQAAEGIAFLFAFQNMCFPARLLFPPLSVPRGCLSLTSRAFFQCITISRLSSSRRNKRRKKPHARRTS